MQQETEDIHVHIKYINIEYKMYSSNDQKHERKQKNTNLLLLKRIPKNHGRFQ